MVWSPCMLVLIVSGISNKKYNMFLCSAAVLLRYLGLETDAHKRALGCREWGKAKSLRVRLPV
jgi:hypothetical protein